MTQTIDYARLGENIRNLRQERRMTQDCLAEKVCCNTSHISNIENNHTKVSLNVLVEIANALGTSVDYILLEQYNDKSAVLDHEIANAMKDLSEEKKRKILKIIEII